LTDTTLALEPVSHDRRRVFGAMDPNEDAEIERTRRIRRIALISVITLLILGLIAGAIYLVAFVILSPTI
jgi:hypothetical protein